MELKDILPLLDPETLKRWTEYQSKLDWSMMEEGKRYTIETLSDFIRNKGFGGDVRESIAQAIEWINDLTDKQILNEKQTQELSASLRREYDSLVDRYEAQMAENTTLDEIKDARGGEVVLGTRLNKINAKIDSLPVNVLELGVLNDGTDSTIAMQEAVNTYRNLYIPDGTYTFEQLVMKDNTNIVASDNAIISLNQPLVNELQYDIDTFGRTNIVNGATRGTYSIELENAIHFKTGDSIEIYNGSWQSPEDWEKNSYNEGADFFKIQLNKIININANIIFLEEPVEFSIKAGSGGVSVFNMNENISIQGGKWIINHPELGFSIKNTKNFNFTDMQINSVQAKTIFRVAYSKNGNISKNKIKNTKNAAIQIFHIVDNINVEDNNIEVEDVFSGDGTIQFYSYITKSSISRNIVKMKHTTGNFSDFMMGIALHTCENNIVSNNHINGFYYGLASYFGAKHNKFTGNEVGNSIVSGILIHRSWYSDFINNTIHSNGLYDGWANPQRSGITILEKSSYINISNNNFHDNRYDILAMDTAYNFQVGNNNSNLTWGSFIKVSRKNGVTERIKLERWTIDGNSYRPSNLETSSSLIHNYDDNINECTVSNNMINGAKIGIYSRMNFTNNIVRNNRFNGTNTGIQLSYLSTLNSFINNYFISNSINSFDATGQAKLNLYKNNVFISSESQYNFSDEFNRSTDNVSLANTAPIGWRIYSINPSSLIEYWEKRTNTGNISDYIAVNK